MSNAEIQTKVPIGAKLRDNDRRRKDEIVVVTGYELGAEDVWVQTGKGIPSAVAGRWEKKIVGVKYKSRRRLCHISLDRIYFDGKTRATGYNAV